MTEISLIEWKAKLSIVAKQTREAMDEGRPFVRWGCLRKLWMQNAYKCLYCGEWYCKPCAEIHFGQTVEQYRSEHPIATD